MFTPKEEWMAGYKSEQTKSGLHTFEYYPSYQDKDLLSYSKLMKALDGVVQIEWDKGPWEQFLFLCSL